MGDMVRDLVMKDVLLMENCVMGLGELVRYSSVELPMRFGIKILVVMLALGIQWDW